MKKASFFKLGLSLVAVLVSTSLAASSEIVSSIDAPIYPIVVQGKELPQLVNRPIRVIQGYRIDRQKKVPILIQIDQRDEKGLYRLANSTDVDFFTAKDELVFLARDLGACPTTFDAARELDPSAPQLLRVRDAGSKHQGCIYLTTSEQLGKPESATFIQYDPKEDRVSTQDYRLSFSHSTPMIIDQVEWRQPTTGKYGPPIAQGMFLEHSGTFLAGIQFVRGPKDYQSKLIGYKAGPIRVIRRTENNLRIIWQLKSPATYIDYVIYPNQLHMDMILDLPFKASWFFKDVKTISALVLPNNQSLQIEQTNANVTGIADGQQNPEEQVLTGSSDTRLAIKHAQGGLWIRMDKASDLPIRAFSYVQETADSTLVGFDTRDWEKLNAQRYHFIFSAFFLPTELAATGFNIVDKTPLPPLE